VCEGGFGADPLRVVANCDEQLGCSGVSYAVDLEEAGCGVAEQGTERDLETGALTNGSATYLAANGDTVDASFEGQAYVNPDGTITGEGNATILGGSGRFASASGAWTWTMSGMFLPDGTTLTTLEGAGWIAYNASDRSD